MKHQDSTDPTAVTPRQAYTMLTKNPQAYLIDIRSTMEHLMVGHPVGAIHVPWLDEPDWVPNPRFATQVREVLLGGLLGSEEENPPQVLLICRSGRRSLEAGRVLIAEGFQQVYHVDCGFEGSLDESHQRSNIAGWRFDGLPWQQC
ncbi:MAG: rhodanese-like domain-containing protein [Arenicellales bacterium]|jgi:rhodanese-related sulfurtransferase|nr:rhodanese-like domain-containing protein [Arenicellales bacterium]MDP6855041.1 rhodanese-like domain-containing protein [Arenicellales bacterium]MDP6949275.1 rhodanese-like domain-containing protein [Arenicellales bacterium]|tara:strand:- start:250 stop:687 length:438 start_codon:yes stop_codon:yes gene_type:complete